MGTRRQVRTELGSLFTANGSFNAVYTYAPVDLQGMTKTLSIYSSESRHDFISEHLNNNFYTFYLDVFVKRESGVNTEDILDDLHEVIRSVIRNNISNSNWSHLDLSDNSDNFFAEVSGISYRCERVELTVKVTQT